MNYKKNFKEKGYIIIDKFLNKGQLNNIKNIKRNRFKNSTLYGYTIVKS